MKNQNSGPNLVLGMGATIYSYSDRTPATVIRITHNGKRIILQEDYSIRVDKNGISENQEYQYQTNTSGVLIYATLRKDGRFRVTATNQLVSLGPRQKYYDYSF